MNIISLTSEAWVKTNKLANILREKNVVVVNSSANKSFKSQMRYANQIKSTFNKGTFDNNNANISFQLTPDEVKTAIGKYPPVIGTKKEAMIGALKKRLGNPKTRDLGMPKNNVQIHELEGGGIVVTGAGKNHEHFKMQVESVLNAEEIEKSSNWYQEAYPVFQKEFCPSH